MWGAGLSVLPPSPPFLQPKIQAWWLNHWEWLGYRVAGEPPRKRGTESLNPRGVTWAQGEELGLEGGIRRSSTPYLAPLLQIPRPKPGCGSTWTRCLGSPSSSASAGARPKASWRRRPIVSSGRYSGGSHPISPISPTSPVVSTSPSTGRTPPQKSRRAWPGSLHTSVVMAPARVPASLTASSRSVAWSRSPPSRGKACTPARD